MKQCYSISSLFAACIAYHDRIMDLIRIALLRSCIQDKKRVFRSFCVFKKKLKLLSAGCKTLKSVTVVEWSSTKNYMILVYLFKPEDLRTTDFFH